MTSRRSFLKGLASLPLVTAIKPSVAEEEPETEEHMGPHRPVICPHCFDWALQDHMCEGYAKWLKENGET